MTATSPPPTAPEAALPIDAVAFAMDVLVDPASPLGAGTPRPAPGVRRLVVALARAGLPPHALAPSDGPPGGRGPGTAACAAHLASAGLGPDVLAVVGAGAALPGVTRSRTLVVTREPETAAGSAVASPPVAVVGDRSVAHAVHAWLAGRIGPYAAARLLVGPLDDGAAADAAAHHLRLTKPPGSLGRLEAIGAQLAAIAGVSPPPLPRPVATAVFAGDHGVHAQGVSPWPQEVTAQMVGNFLAGGAAVNVLAAQAGAGVVVVDVGVATDLPDAGPPDADLPDASPLDAGEPSPTTAAAAPGAVAGPPRLLRRRVRAGTADLSTGAAMTAEESRRALDAGAAVAADLVAGGARCLVTGDMGIANTTPAAALVASLTDRPAAAVTGRGTGIDDALLMRKTALVAAAAARARYLHGSDASGVLAEVGGLEHAALAGFITAGAALQVPVVVDGVIAGAALLVAARLAPGVERGVVAGHRSAEPGASAVLDELGIDPVLDLGMRLGEGSGAVLALAVVEASARVLREMATFDQAGVADKG